MLQDGQSKAACFQPIMENFEALLYLWEECLSLKLEAELRRRILGCQAQMKSFNYFFALSLGKGFMPIRTIYLKRHKQHT